VKETDIEMKCFSKSINASIIKIKTFIRFSASSILALTASSFFFLLACEHKQTLLYHLLHNTISIPNKIFDGYKLTSKCLNVSYSIT